MPDLPWKAFGTPEPGREYLVLATALPLHSRWRVPQFILMTRAVQRQLASAPGLAGYALRAHFWSTRFWTLSAWESEEALNAFVRTMPHVGIMRKLRPHMGATKFARWRELGSVLPLRWDTAIKRLEQD